MTNTATPLSTSPPPCKRLAITVAGAVSLGSYEAGVLFEVIRALGEHNEVVGDSPERIEVDVLTGASAGGMTAVIVAQRLLYDADAFKDPYNNPLYDPWVADVDLDGLLPLQLGDHPKPGRRLKPAQEPSPEPSTRSILSSNCVEALARKYITSRYATGGASPPRKHHPACAAQGLSLGLALSNLNGVTYAYPVTRSRAATGEGAFPYTRFQDEKVGRFLVDGSDGKDCFDEWESWRQAAVSCGAFPFAFRVKELRRLQEEYTRRHLVEWQPPPNRDFAYTDGGLFQNEPLGLAKNLIDQRYGSQDAKKRFYLFVAPGAKAEEVNASLTAANADLFQTAKAVVNATLNQARFQDWVNAEEINASIDRLDANAAGLCTALEADPALATSLQPAADQLLKLLFTPQPPGRPDPTRDKDPDTARARLRNQFADECKRLELRGAAVVRAFLDSLLVLETAAGLNLKDEMRIYDVTATSQELAGHRVFAFSGFFDRRLREHDYNLGRQKARDFLDRLDRKAGPDGLGPVRFRSRDPIPDTLHDGLRDVPMAALPAEVKAKILKACTARAEVGLGDLKWPWLARKLAGFLFIRPLLKGWLKL